MGEGHQERGHTRGVTIDAAANNVRPATDQVIVDIADYVDGYTIQSGLAFENAHYCLIDSLGCAFEALTYPACANLLGPCVPGTVVANGARVPGTSFVLDPVQAAFNIGAAVRWLDFNDTFYGATVIHPSDTLGAILGVADWLSRTRIARNEKPLRVREALESAIKAYEIMGCLALENSFNSVGLDHTILVKIAVAAVATKLLGGTCEEVANAVSNAWLDGHALAAFRRKPNTGSRKSWEAAHAASRGVQLAMLARKGEMGYPSALTAKTWGFYDVMFDGEPFRFQRPYGTYVMENVQFKIAYPAAFHAHTAVEAAIALHQLVKDRLDDIENIELWTHESCRIMLDKTGPLYNPADRDQCLQYTVAIALLFGELTAEYYEDERARDPRIDLLRGKMLTHEESSYSKDYLDPAKRSNANAVRVHFKDGTCTERIEVEYPLGHPRRREEGIPKLIEKFGTNLTHVFGEEQCVRILDLCLDRDRLASTAVSAFVDLMVVQPTRSLPGRPE